MHNREKLLEKLHTGVNRNHCPPMIVSGHSGSGKTWILEQFSQRLGEHPHRVLQASPSESTWPLSGLVALLATSPLTLPPKVFELLSEPPSDDAARFQVALHVQRILVEQLQPRTVIMIDDLDLMDLDSQRVIGFLATKLQGAHIRFVGTIGSGPSPEPFANFSRFPLPALGTAPCTRWRACTCTARSTSPCWSWRSTPPRACRACWWNIWKPSHHVSWTAAGRWCCRTAASKARARSCACPSCG
ncbi:ATP-binding protein [Arthrobacter sp. JCM 19049]|uniref:AAA family ATPase n=1 Tax=Arthrobacter sp. JCM 19049 TaxID=1460643 RepID=UPI0006CF2A27|nr:ATP-binding protein [Arthrobacter sp. JCM 19049]